MGWTDNSAGVTPGNPIKASDINNIINNILYGRTASSGAWVTPQPLPGVIDGSSAAAGIIGEIIETKVLTPANFPASGTYGDLGNVVLSAGAWTIFMYLVAYPNGATVTSVLFGIGTASGNNSSGAVDGDTKGYVPAPTAANYSNSMLFSHVSISISTTYYAKVYAAYTVATPQYVGKICAIRAR